MGKGEKKTTFEDLQQIIADLGKSQQELRESQQELRESQKETDRQMKETDRQLDKRFKELSGSIAKTNGNFNNKWGDFMEMLIEGDLVNLLKERGIEVASTYRRIKIKKNHKILAEFDLIAVNGMEVVVVEVKTSLKVTDVHQFLEKLTTYKNSLGFQKKTIYAGIAFLNATKESLDIAINEGLFAFQAPGGEAQVSIIKNNPAFKPKAF